MLMLCYRTKQRKRINDGSCEVSYWWRGAELNSVDYERAAINAVRALHPDTDDNGCFFHLPKHVYKKVQEN